MRGIYNSDESEVMEADIGEYLTDLPPAVMEALDVQTGDMLLWTIEADGRVTLSKAAE